MFFKEKNVLGVNEQLYKKIQIVTHFKVFELEFQMLFRLKNMTHLKV